MFSGLCRARRDVLHDITETWSVGNERKERVVFRFQFRNIKQHGAARLGNHSVRGGSCPVLKCLAH